MGFAASQARFLSLTARLSDIELETQQITQERLDVLHKMEQYSNAYNDATANEHLIAFVNDGSGEKSKVSLTYDIITKDPLNGGLGMQLISTSGKIVVPSLDDIPKEKDPEDYTIMEEIVNPSFLEKNLNDGNLFFAGYNRNEDTGEFDKKSVAMLNSVTSEYDRSDDAAAKAKYDKQMAAAERQDAMLEMRLKQLDTQHKAIETEMESVGKVVDDNVEKSFKTFG